MEDECDLSQIKARKHPDAARLKAQAGGLKREQSRSESRRLVALWIGILIVACGLDELNHGRIPFLSILFYFQSACFLLGLGAGARRWLPSHESATFNENGFEAEPYQKSFLSTVSWGNVNAIFSSGDVMMENGITHRIPENLFGMRNPILCKWEEVWRQRCAEAWESGRSMLLYCSKSFSLPGPFGKAHAVPEGYDTLPFDSHRLGPVEIAGIDEVIVRGRNSVKLCQPGIVKLDLKRSIADRGPAWNRMVELWRNQELRPKITFHTLPRLYTWLIAGIVLLLGGGSYLAISSYREGVHLETLESRVELHTVKVLEIRFKYANNDRYSQTAVVDAPWGVRGDVMVRLPLTVPEIRVFDQIQVFRDPTTGQTFAAGRGAHLQHTGWMIITIAILLAGGILLTMRFIYREARRLSPPGVPVFWPKDMVYPEWAELR